MQAVRNGGRPACSKQPESAATGSDTSAIATAAPPTRALQLQAQLMLLIAQCSVLALQVGAVLQQPGGRRKKAQGLTHSRLHFCICLLWQAKVVAHAVCAPHLHSRHGADTTLACSRRVAVP